MGNPRGNSIAASLVGPQTRDLPFTPKALGCSLLKLTHYLPQGLTNLSRSFELFVGRGCLHPADCIHITAQETVSEQMTRSYLSPQMRF